MPLLSAATRIVPRMGRVERVETAWLTVERPLARSDCLQVSFMVGRLLWPVVCVCAIPDEGEA
jgi:hypothetical protein